MVLTLEEGKFYRTQAGRKVGPLARIDPDSRQFHPDWKWRGPMPCGNDYWTEEGSGAGDNNIVAEWEPIGPVRTVTRKEIVPGVYGQVRVLAKATNDPFPSHAHVRIDDGLSSATELRAAAATLIEIAVALESPSHE